MDKPILTLSLFLTALSVGLYIYFFEVQSSTSHPKSAKKVVFSFSEDDITELEIQSKQSRFLLTRIAAGHWKVKDKKTEDRADGEIVGALIRALVNLPYQAKGPSKKETLKDFGLDPPSLKLTIRLGHTEFKGAFGRKIPAFKQVYFQMGSDIYSVPSYFLRIFQRSFFALREKRLIETSSYEIDTLLIQRPARLFEFRKKNQKWYFTRYPLWKGWLAKGSEAESLFRQKPLGRIALWAQRSGEWKNLPFLPPLVQNWIGQNTVVNRPIAEFKVKELLRKLSALRAKKFISPTLENIQKLGLSPRRVFAKIFLFKNEKLQNTLLLWRTDEGLFYSLIRTANRQGILALGKGLERLFKWKDSSFQFRSIFPWSGDQIVGFSLRYKQKTYRFSKDKQWIWKGHRDFPLDQKEVQAFVRDLLSLQKEKFPSWPKKFSIKNTGRLWSEKIKTTPLGLSTSGLQKPQITLKMTRIWDEKRETFTLEVGKKSGPSSYYGWLSHSLPLFTLSLTGLKPFFNQRVFLLREKRMLPHPDKLQSLTLQKAKASLAMIRSSAGEFFLGKSKKGLPKKVETFLELLVQQRARGFFNLTPALQKKHFSSIRGEIHLFFFDSKKRTFLVGRLSLGRLPLWEKGKPYGFWVEKKFWDFFSQAF